MKNTINKIGVSGAVFAAAACPTCFPKLAAIGATLSLGALAPLEIYFLWGAQFFVMLSLVEQFMVFQRLRNITLFLSSILFAVVFFISLYAVVAETLSTSRYRNHNREYLDDDRGTQK